MQNSTIPIINYERISVALLHDRCGATATTATTKWRREKKMLFNWHRNSKVLLSSPIHNRYPLRAQIERQ